MKSMRTLIAALLAVAVLPLLAGENQSEVDKKLQQLEKQLQLQNERIVELQSQLNETQDDVSAGLAQVKDDEPVFKLGNKSKQFELKGDLRVRFEQRDRADNDLDDMGVDRRRRFRHRFRLGMKFKTDWGWEAAAGLCTGGEDGTSTNFTWNDNTEWETGDIRLDYAYVTHKWGDTKLTVGQHKNPYKHAGILFDSDLRPTGVSLQQGLGPAFLTAGVYEVRYLGSNEGLGLMAGLQAGVKVGGGPVGATFAVATYNYNSPYTDEVGLGDSSGETSAEEYKFQLLDLYADVSVKFGDIGKGKIYFEYTENFGAEGESFPDVPLGTTGGGQRGGDIDPEANNQHYVIGSALEVSRFKFSVDYINTEADALPERLIDGDFGTGVESTDIDGYRFKAGVKLAKNCSIGLAYLRYRRQDEYDLVMHGVNRDEAELYQVDLKYKF